MAINFGFWAWESVRLNVQAFVDKYGSEIGTFQKSLSRANGLYIDAGKAPI